MTSILVLSPAFPYPAQSGGDIRLFELLRHLAVHFELHLLSYGSGNTDEFIRQCGVKSVTLIPGGQPAPSGRPWQRSVDLWRGAPHGMRLNADPVFLRAEGDRGPGRTAICSHRTRLHGAIREIH